MADIKINEFSSDYSYNVGTASFCTVALPITASWGPAFEDPASVGKTLNAELEATAFSHFASSQDGLEKFIATYRGPATSWRSSKDFSYQLAMTLLTAGYDLDVCRLCSGTHAQGAFATTDEEPKNFTLKAKYPGTFGNNLLATLTKLPNPDRWNLITYVVDASGQKTAVENLIFVFNLDDSTDSILHISEITSNFFTFAAKDITTENVTFASSEVRLTGGSDRAADGTAEAMLTDAIALATARFAEIPAAVNTQYLAALNAVKTAGTDTATASNIRYREWLYKNTMDVLTILTDRLSYNSNRIVLPGWDDLDIEYLTGEKVARMDSISPLHARLMEVAAGSRCATALIDIPRALDRGGVYNDTGAASTEGYVQKLSEYVPAGVQTDGLFSTHSAIFAPWGQFVYVGTGKQQIAPPSLFALLIQRGMIVNQPLQYEWAMPTTRKHNVQIGALDYIVPKALLDVWQSKEGVGVNVIANIPDLGLSIWGNSTAYDVPPATYNALANLSTRYLMNAVRNQAFRCGLAITFQYNNDEAYSKFYAGVTPLLDTMKSVGAIAKYDIQMAADINGNDSISANSVIGSISLWVYGVIDQITVDPVALPVVDE